MYRAPIYHIYIRQYSGDREESEEDEDEEEEGEEDEG